ncbi:DUF72 domain-containing protein [Sphingomonas immobilis]|uniref:DUF72 domain-containing protein n=1 Tax=Sphingomonas immobilis TaxID=3063997 RepID=A0ABT8ZWI3_9SPHN|nr:DUF72 domain-containing protein [Sphingomonas sp. CA1-15]MDO7841936.1 DUF72 domain-containing protein [Sphingomonas sp. CA1-15]
MTESSKAAEPRYGTAGWSIPRASTEAFPAHGSHLERYASLFPAVEINSSFHRPHKRATYERWAASTPPDFRFSVKIPKDISHGRKLVDAHDALATFLDQAGGLGSKLEVLLLQLPPSFAFDAATATSFFEMVRGRVGPDLGLACEPRHASWAGDGATAAMLAQHVARVAADPVLLPDGAEPGGWSGLRYHRLHGAPRIYYSPYDAERLELLARSIVAEGAAGSRCWSIFDNTASGAATTDTLSLQRLLRSDAL